ncbi:amino acid transporter AVT6C-like [Impatiens glandulifera]|uniref:amino acid transporter AVT6C-like n=1 Tax=Impatiens glandulifera TaxID=253017 RepID=UPI001FB08303|nr:amino acid transporter AVT6C-like [Impatiens glandulifera]
MNPGKCETTGALAPLLPRSNPIDKGSEDGGGGGGGASISGAVFNVSTSMIGAGIMSIPATLKVLGILPGFFLILLVALSVDVTVEFLLRYTGSADSSTTTYGGVMAESFGKTGSVALQICVVVTNIGAMIIYMIIIGDVLSGNQSEGTFHLGILQEWFGIQWWNSRVFSLLFITLFVMLPLLLLRNIDSLRHASAISILLAVVFVVICSTLAIFSIVDGRSQNVRLLPDFSSGLSVFDLFTTIPVYATAFGCHVSVHPVRAELSRASDMKPAVRLSLLLCVAVYSAIGFFGYLLFGESIMTDLLVNFDQSYNSAMGSVINDVVRLSYAVHLMMVFPVINYTLRANLDELLFPNKHLLANDSVRFVGMTCVLLSLVYLAAIAIPDIWYFFQFMGTTTVMCIMFLFPCAIILRDKHGIAGRGDKVMASVVVILAVGTSLIAISSNVYNFMSNNK